MTSPRVKISPDGQQLLRKIRKAQRDSLDINEVYYFYNEDTTHHFHIWMVPRYEWMTQLGRSVESLRPVLLRAQMTLNFPDKKDEILAGVKKIRQSLTDALPPPK